MDILQSILEAVDSLTSNKLRSALTILGIVIGVGAVIAMLAIGRGAQNSITGSISSIGTNLLFVIPGGGQDIRNPRPLTQEDAKALNDPLNAPAVVNAAPVLTSNADVTFEGQSARTQVFAVTAGYDNLRNLSVTEGQFISDENILGRAAVAVLGPDTATNLFGRSEGVTGETIRLDGQPFRVIGVLKAQGGSGFSNPDDQIIVPLTTAQARLVRKSTRNAVDMILVQAASAQDVPVANEQVAEILRSRHRTPVGSDDFTVFTQQSFLDIANTITGVLTVFLGGIAGISLLVGGIGIMNIMLVSVTERIREIGIRMSVGAKERDILLQFLAEAIVLSVFGGLLGIALGIGLSKLLPMIPIFSGWKGIVSVNSIILAFVFSGSVGVFFGFYPARKASKLDPIEALRYE
jgi:putative ABC transport system permease protein